MPQQSSKLLNGALLVIAICIVFVFANSWQSLFTLWANFELAYSHGLLASILALLYTFHIRSNFSAQQLSPSWFALVGLAGSTMVWFASDFIQIQVGAQLMLVPIIYFSLASLFGLRKGSLLAPALLYLLLSIPVWDYINTNLQDLTTSVATLVLQASGLAVFIEGNIINIPYGTFEIAGGCSGLRYFLVAMVLALYFSVQGKHSLKTCLAVLLATAFFALLANWIRVLLIIVIGYESEMQSSIVDDHETFGWLIFAAVAVPAFKVLSLIETHGKQAPGTKSASQYTVPQDTTPNDKPAPSLATGTYVMLVAVLACLLSVPTILQPIANAPNTNTYALQASATEGWRATRLSNGTATGDWQLAFVGGQALTQHFARSYRDRITVNANYYPSQTQGEELVGYHNKLANPAKWRIQSAPSKLTRPEQLGVLSHVIRNKKGQQKLIYSYYQIGDNTYISELKTKLGQLSSLFSTKVFQGYMAYGIDCRRDCMAESAVLSRFIDQYYRSGIQTK